MLLYAANLAENRFLALNAQDLFFNRVEFRARARRTMGEGAQNSWIGKLKANVKGLNFQRGLKNDKERGRYFCATIFEIVAIWEIEANIEFSGRWNIVVVRRVIKCMSGRRVREARAGIACHLHHRGRSRELHDLECTWVMDGTIYNDSEVFLKFHRACNMLVIEVMLHLLIRN